MRQGGIVLIADDHPLTREGLALAARAAMPGISIVATGTITQAEAAIAGRESPRLILLDFKLPDSHGYSGFLRLQHLAGKTPIVVISANESPNLVEAAKAIGAAGYIFKSRPLDEVAIDLKAVDTGGTCFPPEVMPSAAIAAARARIDDLSGAQMRVLLALADGRLNKQIAGDLGISEATVKAHMSAIFRKLRVANRTQALLAMQPLFAGGSAIETQ